MICEKCEHEFIEGELYYNSIDGILCELCLEDYLEKEKKEMENEYTPYNDLIDIETNNLRDYMINGRYA